MNLVSTDGTPLRGVITVYSAALLADCFLRPCSETPAGQRAVPADGVVRPVSDRVGGCHAVGHSGRELLGGHWRHCAPHPPLRRAVSSAGALPEPPDGGQGRARQPHSGGARRHQAHQNLRLGARLPRPHRGSALRRAAGAGLGAVDGNGYGRSLGVHPPTCHRRQLRHVHRRGRRAHSRQRVHEPGALRHRCVLCATLLSAAARNSG